MDPLLKQSKDVGSVGSRAGCHQRNALTSDDVRPSITQILSFVSLSYRLFAVDEEDGAPFRL